MQECGEAVVRRRLGELAFVSVALQRGIGVGFEYGCARTIAAQRNNERQMLDRNRDVGMIRLARGPNLDCLASRCSRARKIVHRDEKAREVIEQDGEPARIGTGAQRWKRLPSKLDRSLRVTARVLDLGEIERRNLLAAGVSERAMRFAKLLVHARSRLSIAAKIA